MRIYTGVLLLLITISPVFSFTDSPDVVGKYKIKTYLIYDPVIWPAHWYTSKHSFIKPGFKFGLADSVELNANFTVYELGFMEYFTSIKYKMPYSSDTWIHSMVLTWNHMPNKKLEEMPHDHGWVSPFQQVTTKTYYRTWNTHVQYHFGYRINETVTLSLNIGVQYWSLVNPNPANAQAYESGNHGFAPAFSFPAVHINFSPKSSMTLSYGDGDSGDLGLIGFGYLWN